MTDPKKNWFLVKLALARSLPPAKFAKRLFFAEQNTEPRKLCDVNYSLRSLVLAKNSLETLKNNVYFQALQNETFGF